MLWLLKRGFGTHCLKAECNRKVGGEQRPETGLITEENDLLTNLGETPNRFQSTSPPVSFDPMSLKVFNSNHFNRNSYQKMPLILFCS